MTSLSTDMIRELVSACHECGLARESLLKGLSSGVVATLHVSDTPIAQLFCDFCDLNGISWQEHPHPLVEVLKNARFFAGGRPQERLFDEAIGYLEKRSPLVDPSIKSAVVAIATRRVKEDFLGLNCYVTPPLDAPAGPFLVEHPTGLISVVAVAYWEDVGADVEQVIDIVNEWLHVARRWGNTPKGYVVLTPSSRPAERERVLQEGLEVIEYQQRKGVQLDTIESVMQRRLDEPSILPAVGFSVLEGAEAQAADAALANFLKDFQTRVLLVVRPRAASAEAFLEALFRVAARTSLKHGPPAPFPIGSAWQTRGLVECVHDEFTRCGELVAPNALLRAVQEGVICPILACDPVDSSSSRLHAAVLPRVLEGRSERSKAIVVVSTKEAAQGLERSLREVACKARIMRTVS